MRRLQAVLGSLVGLVFLALPAGAAILPVGATFSVSAFGQPPLTLSGSGVGTSNGFGNPATVPGGIFAGNPAAVVLISPTFVGLTSLSIPANSVGNPAGSFAQNGAMGLSGFVFFNGMQGIPLAPLGGGGNAAIIFGSIPMKVLGATWMYSANKVFTGMGAALANPISVTATAFDNRTAGGLGSVQLVAPGSLLVSGGALANLPLFATLTLTYTPEPGTLVLLGSGIAMLGALGRGKLRRGAA